MEAEIKLTVNSQTFELLNGLDLAEYFITSKAVKIKSVDQQKLEIEVQKTNGTKCERCWKVLEKKCSRCEDATSEKN